jgi:hypothetical protein
MMRASQRGSGNDMGFQRKTQNMPILSRIHTENLRETKILPAHLTRTRGDNLPVQCMKAQSFITKNR